MQEMLQQVIDKYKVSGPFWQSNELSSHQKKPGHTWENAGNFFN